MSLEVSASINFYGRVIGFKEPRLTRGRDWAMNLVVIDDSFEGRADLGSLNPSGMSVMIFRPNREDFPAVKSIGDIVQFRHFRTQYYETTIQAISTKWSAFTVFRKDPTSQEWKAFPDRQIHPEEVEVIEKIQAMKLGVDAVKFELEGVSATVLKACALRPTLTVSEIRNGMFFNGTFKVIKISENESGVNNQFSLLVCDYTENPFLSADPTVLQLPAYLNQSLLPVTLWDNFADEARKLQLKDGDFVYFDNLVGRQVRHTDGSTKILAVLHGDPKAKNLEEKFIRIQKDAKKIALIESQAVRLEQLKQSLASEDLILKAASAAATIAKPSPSNSVLKVKKLQTKRTFAIKKEEEEKNEAVEGEKEKINLNEKIDTISSTNENDIANVSIQPLVTTSIGGGDSFAVTTILSVRSYPADNSKFCIKARVVLIYPSQSLYEAVRFVCGDCGKTTPLPEFRELDQKCSLCNKSVTEGAQNRFIWVFCVVLEDATGDLPVIVAEEDAVDFLGIPAFNLYDPENESKINQVSSIFKTLVELEEEQLFCIKSYRVNHPSDNSSSIRYRLFNTNLVSSNK